MHILTAMLALAACGSTPTDAVAICRIDVERQAVESRPYVRYLSLIELPPEIRRDVARVLSGHTRGLSRETELTPLTVIAGGQILRLDLRDYGWSVELWEKLAEADPYYHVRIEWPGGIWPGDGKQYKAAAFRVKAIAPWMSEGEHGPENLAALVLATNSQAPLVRGDWFFNQTASAVDREPNYYTFLGVKNLGDYQKIVGIDPKRKRNKIELRESVEDSGVSIQARAVVREDSDEGGYLWSTLDVRKATDKVNPLRVLGRTFQRNWDAAGKGDAAQELIGTLPNSLVVYGLFNNAGEIQASAPDFVGGDRLTQTKDTRIHNPVSCVRCHTDRALQSIDGFVRETYQTASPLKLGDLDRPPLILETTDHDEARLAKGHYGRKLDPILKRDREQYETALAEATCLADDDKGLTGAEYHRLYADLWHRTEDARYDLVAAAADLCVPTERLKLALERAVAARSLEPQTRADEALSSLLKGGRRLDKNNWQEAYPLARIALAAYTKGP